jgi:hypothetical protein
MKFRWPRHFLGRKEDFSEEDSQSGPFGSATLEIEKLDSSRNGCGFFRRRVAVSPLTWRT